MVETTSSETAEEMKYTSTVGRRIENADPAWLDNRAAKILDTQKASKEKRRARANYCGQWW